MRRFPLSEKDEHVSDWWAVIMKRTVAVSGMITQVRKRWRDGWKFKTCTLNVSFLPLKLKSAIKVEQQAKEGERVACIITSQHPFPFSAET